MTLDDNESTIPIDTAANAATVRNETVTVRRQSVLVAATIAITVIAIVVAVVIDTNSKSTTNHLATNQQPSLEVWASRVDAVCAKYQTQLRVSTAGADVIGTWRIGQKATDDLHALGLPSEKSDVAQTLLAVLDQAVNDLNNNDVDSYNAAIRTALPIERELGLTVCTATAKA